MKLSLVTRLKNIIYQIQVSPEDSFQFNISVPFTLLTKMREYLKICAEKKDKGDQIIRSEITNNALETTIRQILLKLYSLGYTYDKHQQIAENAIKYSIEYIVQNYPGHLVWKPFNVGIIAPDETTKKIDKQIYLTRITYMSPWYELMYGTENSLFFWDGHKWTISTLGEFFMTLSVPSGTTFLLLLESYFSPQGDSSDIYNINSWHISKEYLKSFYKGKSICVDIGEVEYPLINLDPNLEYLHRLEEFQLIKTFDKTAEHRGNQGISDMPILYFGDDFYEMELTDLGRNIISNVLYEKDNLLSIIIENLISFELIGVKFHKFTEKDVINQLYEVVQNNSEITGDQIVPIEQILEDLKSNKSSIVTLRSIPPTIERILKNILLDAKIILSKDMNKLMLNQILTEYEKLITLGKPIIERDTITYIKNFDRNSILHANVSPNDGIKDALISLMLNVLLKIYQDYTNWKC